VTYDMLMPLIEYLLNSAHMLSHFRLSVCLSQGWISQIGASYYQEIFTVATTRTLVFLTKFCATAGWRDSPQTMASKTGTVPAWKLLFYCSYWIV